MNKKEQMAIEEVISLLKYAIKYGERSFWYEDTITTCESCLQEALEILRAISNKTKGDKHERT